MLEIQQWTKQIPVLMDLYILVDIIICNWLPYPFFDNVRWFPRSHQQHLKYVYQLDLESIIYYLLYGCNVGFAIAWCSEKKEKKHLLNIYNVPCTLLRILTYLISFNFHNRSERQVLFLFSSVKKLRLRDVKLAQDHHITNEWQAFIQT